MCGSYSNLGAFQHLEREKAVNALIADVAADGFSERWPGVKRILLELRDDSAWESQLGSLLGAKVVIPSIDDKVFDSDMEAFCLSLLSHSEVRVRNAVAQTLGELSSKHGAEVWERCRDTVLHNITSNYERDESAPAEATADDRDAPGSPSLGAASGNAPALLSSLLSTAYQPAQPGTGACRHTTEGWKALESSVRALHHVAAGAGASFAPHATPEVRGVLYDCFNHMNRFVRETAFLAAAAVCAALRGLPELSNIAAEVAEKLRDGLSDNWSQVRFASSRATRELLQGVPEARREDLLPLLLPAMCLNRYYVAEGVRVFSQESWRVCFGTTGRQRVAQHISAVVPYYTSQSKANNHAVREAACACIGELCEKVDRAAVEPHVPTLLHALLVCFNDESWPCRDAAAAGSAALAASYPAAAASRLPELWRLWLEHLGDNVPSVRETAAMAIGKVAAATPDDSRPRVEKWLSANLSKAKDQPEESDTFSALQNTTQFGVALPKKPAVPDPKHTDRAMFSCGSLAPKLKGGCMDHGFSRAKEPWEVSDGGLFLLRECAQAFPDLVTDKLPEASELARLQHFEHCWKLHETLWAMLPVLAASIGKRSAKQHLELFLTPMFKDLRCGNQLCEAAAGKCVAFFRDWLGPSILMGRLDDMQKQQMQSCDAIPAKASVSTPAPAAAGRGDPPRPERAAKVGLADKMRDLPPGAPIPNLLAK
eukprot:jgi/Ulvmu1/2530/UM138_0035.1